MELATQDDHTFLYGQPEQREWAYARAKEMGVTTIRFVFYESYLERLGWKIFDDAVKECLSHGIKPQVVLTGTPEWDNQPGKVAYVNPTPASFATWAKKSVYHLSELGVKTFSLWNEPNHPGFLKVTNGKTAEHYSRLYDAAYKEVRKEAPHARILFGELAGGISGATFLNKCATGHEADGYAVHAYQFKTRPGKSSIGNKQTFGNLPKVQKRLKLLAQENKLQNRQGNALPIYVTEMGWFMSGWDSPMSKNWGIDEKTRVSYAANSIKLGQKWGLKQLVYYHLVMPEVGTDWNTGILFSNGVPTPTYTAIKKAYVG